MKGRALLDQFSDTVRVTNVGLSPALWNDLINTWASYSQTWNELGAEANEVGSRAQAYPERIMAKAKAE